MGIRSKVSEKDTQTWKMRATGRKEIDSNEIARKMKSWMKGKRRGDS